MANSTEITLEDILNMKAEANKTTQRKPCGLFLNVGKRKNIQVTTQEGDVVNKEMKITLPYNIDLTNMPSRKIPAKEGEYKTIIVNSNELLELLRKIGATMKDGESKPLNLQCWLTKVSTEEPKVNSSDMLINADDLLG